jgi:hypothetical protein
VLKAGQAILLNNRRWHLRRVQPLGARTVELEAIGTSEAAQGMTRRMTAYRYDDDLFIEQRRQQIWQAHLQRDWIEDDQGPVLHCRAATWLEVLDAHTRRPAAGDLKNSFSWSYSRAAKYEHCPRAYYYHYYAAWEGWLKDAPAPVKRAYLLKNLTDVSLWAGSLVHEAIKFALARLKAGQTVAEGDLLKQMRVRAQRDFDDSRQGRYRQQPNKRTGFQEHYYKATLLDEAWRSAWTQAEQRLQTFLNSALYLDLCRQPPAAFLDVEALQSFRLAGTKVWVQLDLARRAEGAIVIYDWKTGSIEEAAVRRQLGVYGLYLVQAYPELAHDTPRLQGIVYRLADDRLLEFDLDEALLRETQTMAEASIAKLRGLLLDDAANLAELRRFPMIDDLSICRRCQFRELCGRDKGAG